MFSTINRRFSPTRAVHFVIRIAVILSLTLILSTGSALSASADTFFQGIQQAREYRTAVGLLKQGDYDLARTQYETFIEKYPDSSRLPRAYFGLAETYYLQNQFGQAAELYLRSLKEGKLSENYYEQAMKRGLDAANRSGHYELGEDYIREIDQSMDRVTDTIMRRVVQVLARNNQTKLALKWSRKKFEENPDSSYWRYETALLHADLNEYKTARDLLQPLLVGSSDYENDATYLMAEINFETSQFERARQYYSDLTSDPTYADDARYGLAWIDIKQRNTTGAKAKLEALTEDSRKLRSKAARDLARIYRSEENKEATVKWYNRAIEWSDEPLQSELRIEFGDYYVNNNHLKKAIPFYESARGLGLKATKRLVRGYLLQNDYDQAARKLESLQSDGKLGEPLWKRRLALSYFHLGKYREALKVLPSTDAVSSRDEQRQLMSLRGSLYYRLGEWNKSRDVFESMSKQFSRLEPKYYLALLDEKMNESSDAIKRLRDLRETTSEEPWQSRIDYQLARLYYESGQYDRYEDHSARVDSSVLSAPINNEFDLLKLANTVRQNPEATELRKRAKRLRDRSVEYGQLNEWYGYLAKSTPPADLWTDMLIPSLLETDTLRRKWGSRTVAVLRNQGLLEKSFQVAKKLIDADDDTGIIRSVRGELLDTLRAQQRYRSIGRYLPVKSDWQEWSGDDLRALAHALSSYHRSTNQPRSGLKALKNLRSVNDKINSKLANKIEEWTAGFEIELNQYETARERLRAVPPDRRSFSGDLNLIIANYHLGDTETSLRRIEDLRNERTPAPLPLYDYAFRILRDSNRSDELHDWSLDLVERQSTTDTRTRALLLDNVQYWVNSGDSERGLEYIQRLDPDTRTPDNRIKLGYYRALAYFNEGKLSRAERILSELRHQRDPDEKWLRRILQSEIEISLRRNNWEDAFRRWQTMHEAGLGSSGRRLLTENGLTSNPEAFETLVETLRRSYESVLPEGEAVFWLARIDEHRNNSDRAVDRYETYLDQNHENHRHQATLRLARLYDKLGQHEQSLEHYRELHSRTGDARYRLRVGVQQRKLGRYAESRKTLRDVLSQSDDFLGVGHYQLAHTHLQDGNNDKALNLFRKAIRNGKPSDDWMSDARRRSVKIALKKNKLNVAKPLIQKIDDEVERRLFGAELKRQQGKLDSALDEINGLSRESLTTQQRRQYRSVASAILWQTDNYSRLLQLYDEVPDEKNRKIWYVKSLIRTGELDRVRERLPTFSDELRSEILVSLADAYYKNSKWQTALELYEKAPDTLRTTFRIGNAYRQLDNAERAYETWRSGLVRSSDEADTEWLQSILDGLVVVTPQLDRRAETSRLIDEHWTSAVPDQSTVGIKGFRWAITTREPDLIQRYVHRIRNPDESTVESLANELANNGNWASLRDWIDKAEQSESTARNSLVVKYYSSLADFKMDEQSVNPEEINTSLNEALREQSQYAQKLQVLLGDYHFENKNFTQAAIEYRKVDMLFENKSPDPRVQLNLARSYLKLDKLSKARAIFEDLSDDSVPEPVRKEANEWLREHPES